MLARFREASAHAFERAMADNTQQIIGLLDAPGTEAMLDVGCDDGEKTLLFARALGATCICGTEVVEERVAVARSRGIQVTIADIEDGFPFPDAGFDVVTSNQVIEHLADTDRFVREVYRVLRPGGFAVISTENLASWHNIAALILGWQPFSLTNVTAQRLGLGNPLALHREESWEQPPTWQHRRVFAYRALVELFESHGFEVAAVCGAGYYPLPRSVARLEPRHAAFLTVKVIRPA